jgi:hypothetical protein
MATIPAKVPFRLKVPFGRARLKDAIRPVQHRAAPKIEPYPCF